ncbi:general secretion pathway protein GspN [Lysobacter sp. H21R4]|uniref:general secretion pathway protein GspN n=1 Tax=Lysobacter sp. H21R4 TaxID=2781021 RepID=UPI001888E4F6|nr:general secretion pathway protein GspN [Lysobacter sp. H21R4]QOY63125.1 general secretion pathway protein GspN [Lysobacter sp. H21R4]
MRLDALGPRTRLLAGVAGWALLAWVLAVAGMGGRVALLADDPTLLNPLPQIVPTQPALGPFDQYQGIADRPLFAKDRRPHPFFMEGGGDERPSEEFDYVLTSVLIAPGTTMAIVRKRENGEPIRVKLDAPLADSGWRLVEVSPRGAVFEGPQGRRSLELALFDGNGPVATSAALPSGGAAPAPDNRADRGPQPGRAPSAQSAAPPPAMPQPETASPNREPQPTESESEPADPSQTSEPAQAQMDSIRKRIEARRAALRKDEM